MSRPDIEGLGSEQEHDRANATVNAINKLIELSISTMPGAGGKVALAVGCAISPLAILALVLGEERPGDKSTPNIDQVTFGAMYFICGIEKYGDGIIAGFNPEIVRKAMVMFKETTGREYTDIHPDLLQTITEREESATVPPAFKKFMPH